MAGLDGTVKIPLAGEVSKKTALIGGAVFAAFIGVMYIRHRNNANTTNNQPGSGTAAAQAGDTGLVTDPAGNQCTAVDPNSGYCPGTAEDTAYQTSQQSGGYGYGGYTGTSIGDTGGSYGGAGLYVDPNGNTCVVPDANGYCPPATGGATGNQTYANNEAWLTAAESAMHAPALNDAAERIFAGLAVTNSQKDLFLEAVGLIGDPPNGYPTIHLKDTAAHPGNSDSTVPTVTGQRRIVATATLRTAGFSPVVEEAQHVPAGKEAVVISTEPNGGAKARKGTKVTVRVGPR